MNIFGQETVVTLKMRKAALFAYYDSASHTFVVDGSRITDDMVGLHKITVETTYTDPKGQTQFFSKSFYLKVEPDPSKLDLGPVEEFIDDRNIVSQADFKGIIMVEPQPKSTERPVPYIAEFSQTGVMTIGWDRAMKPYEKPKEIPPTQIAIEPAIFEGEKAKKVGSRLL